MPIIGNGVVYCVIGRKFINVRVFYGFGMLGKFESKEVHWFIVMFFFAFSAR